MPVDPTQKQAFNEQPSDHPDNQGPGQEHQVGQIRAQPNVEDLQGQIRSEIRTERIQATMGDVQNAQHAEDERKTYRQQKQHCSKHAAIQQNDGEQGHARPFSVQQKPPLLRDSVGHLRVFSQSEDLTPTGGIIWSADISLSCAITAKPSWGDILLSPTMPACTA